MDRLGKFASLFDEHFRRFPPDYERFAKILSDLARRERPWQKTFVYNILRQTPGFSVGDQMWDALLAFEKERGGAIRRQTILSAYKVERFSVALSESKECFWEECPEHFIPDHPNRKYHAERCRMDARNKRRRGTLIRDE